MLTVLNDDKGPIARALIGATDRLEPFELLGFQHASSMYTHTLKNIHIHTLNVMHK